MSSLREQITETLLEYRDVVLIEIKTGEMDAEELRLDAEYGADIVIAQMEFEDRKRKKISND